MAQDFLQGVGSNVTSSDGSKIGAVEEIYLDQETDQPEWVLVKTGMMGGSRFVPLAQASMDGDNVTVPYDGQKVKDSPDVMADGELSQEEEAELYRYYGLEYSESSSDSGLPGGTADTDQTETVGRDVSGPTTDDAMTRSEEELQVGKTQSQAGQARLKKYVVTENVTETVPVQREELRIEREPITDANADEATSGPEISEEEHEVTLTEEEVVANKQVVPKERVQMTKDTVTEEREVSEELRKERIEAEGDVSEKSV
ncbi:MAG: PRC and DUF2382 domain-containing protein [Actinomycetota bacterium]|nr:PRC and DUF2382 domain-containing protein [Actinomycetota bacterium]